MLLAWKIQLQIFFDYKFFKLTKTIVKSHILNYYLPIKKKDMKPTLEEVLIQLVRTNKKQISMETRNRYTTYVDNREIDVWSPFLSPHKKSAHILLILHDVHQ